jgi:hypothetical protein
MKAAGITKCTPREKGTSVMNTINGFQKTQNVRYVYECMQGTNIATVKSVRNVSQKLRILKFVVAFTILRTYQFTLCRREFMYT